MMNSKSIALGMLGGIVLAAVGCTQTKAADDGQQGTYSAARHKQIGSNIPQPNRGGGNEDRAETELEREQFMHNSQLSTLGGAGGTLRGGGIGGR